MNERRRTRNDERVGGCLLAFEKSDFGDWHGFPTGKTVPVPAPSDDWRDVMQPFLARRTRERVAARNLFDSDATQLT